MRIRSRQFIALIACASAALLSTLLPRASAQTLGEVEEFTATAIVNNERASGAGTVLIRVTRWSADMERMRLIDTLKQKGPEQLLDELKGMRSVGSIRTPDSLAYDLRYAHERPGEDGGRQIVLATDRPIGFWEAVHRPRTIQYPFTVIQMQMGSDGNGKGTKGKGTLSYATKIVANRDGVELENFDTQPVMLTEITARKAKGGFN
ncbi:MAG TPA: hypothetical protein VFB92_24980 [Vicinamibacterales bacterium]|jgi:hypothetical protein|nr:hypothetical protein [Vicinamibacterales bacterium]